MTVIKIVQEYLKANNFDGLLNTDIPCGCSLDDLVPCESDCSGCIPAYKHMDPREDNPGGWAMWRTKETPSAKQWESVEY